MSTTAQPSTVSQPASAERQHSRMDSRSVSQDRPLRTQSTHVRTNPSSSPRRALSTSQAPAQAPPSHARSPSANLQHVARNDFEQTNLARPPNSGRQSESNERFVSGPPVARSESMRQAPASHRSSARYNSDQSTPATLANGAAPPESRPAPTNLRRRTTIDAQTGHWDLGKTIGAGSMGKVKLARNKKTGEQVAVKIVPRQSTEGEHRTPAERERADHSKEVRTAREAAIVTLVDHPYICGMRDVVRTNYHWYMLFEYVNGGQMLDYIISHGRLKEKQARKFGRQIASALDYCHRNSIVHRDLKIENILISKNGDIKIIDFGLSNLFSPRSHLKTFCGSLYFAAPELLQAKQYTGPEVDVWSFGIVMYVLVCGKVPFDDQSMPQLHAKIKKGNVDYPPWLSQECRSLIARMLNTNPAERATLQEIMTHPWMVKGFNGAPENYLPVRKPLTLPLDPDVVDKMSGFDFGSPEVIAAQLTKVIESEDYQRAVRAAERRVVPPMPEAERKRGVFDFYKRRTSISSRDTLNTPSAEAISIGQDPTNAYHPLISVYYLAMEKKEREAREENPGGLAMPQSPGEKPLQVPDLPAPEAAYTNSQRYEMAGEKPTGGRTRPRARTHGEEDAVEASQKLNAKVGASSASPAIVEPALDQHSPQPAKRESTASSLLRRLSTRRYKDPSDRAERSDRLSHPPSALSAYSAADGSRISQSGRLAGEPGAPGNRPEADAVNPNALQVPSVPNDDSSERKRRSHGLGRSISVNSSDMRRRISKRGASEGSSMRPQLRTSGSHERRESMLPQNNMRDAASDVEGTSRRPQSVNLGNRTRSGGHSRKESMPVRRSRPSDAHRTADVPEETDAEIQDELDGGPAERESPNGFKPVYLRGFFSSSTTSSKPLQDIRADIIRVLQQLGVDYAEIKGGFRCRHTPSIKPSSDDTALPAAQPLNPALDAAPHKRKISFGGFLDRSNADRDSFRAQHGRSRPSYMQSEDESEDDHAHGATHARPNASGAGRAAGETSTQVQSDLGSSMALKFEIIVVKVPLLSLHGIQFKKVDGGTWQYKNMAQTILNELRL